MWSQPSLVEKVIISVLQFLIGAKYLELISANQPCGFTLVAVYSIDRPAIQGNTAPNAACYDIKRRSGNSHHSTRQTKLHRRLDRHPIVLQNQQSDEANQLH